jgi:hypothetical protein
LTQFSDTLLGAYIGTRVIFDLHEVNISVQGTPLRVFVLHVPRSQSMYPNLLRKEIVLRPGLVRKVKYLKGTLFYRLEDETFSESPDEDVDSRARELQFTGTAPRTRTSFLLLEDKPGLRLYAPINDRFFGREVELAELIPKFDDPRGRGISIAGFGGVGKTELAIKLVSELYRRGKFRTIYSGSAKQSLLGPGGVQAIDPVFMDLKSFLSDLAGWLGLDLVSNASTEELEQRCLSELGRDCTRKTLLFVDNLETVGDRSLIHFLDNKLPSNCWLVATGRVHKIRNYIYPKELREMDEDSAACLLRYELRRQGLQELAARHINDLKNKAEKLYYHPLALRWFAWACKKSPKVWMSGIGTTDEREIETFCVANTLGNLDKNTQKVLGAILAIADTTLASADCIQRTSGLPEAAVDTSLWELECSGLIYAGTGENGVVTYTVAPLAERPVSELARMQGWEREYVSNLRAFTRQQTNNLPESPLARDLLKVEPSSIRYFTKEEITELDRRIERALNRVSSLHALKLKWLRAECERHLSNFVTADDLYRECADAVISGQTPGVTAVERNRILLEAATVAKLRAQTDAQLRRAIQYLEAIRDSEFSPMRVLGMLTEFYAMLGDLARYQLYASQAARYKEENPYERFDSLDGALARAEGHIQRRMQRVHN